MSIELSTDGVRLPRDHEDYDYRHGYIDGVIEAAAEALAAMVDVSVIGTRYYPNQLDLIAKIADQAKYLIVRSRQQEAAP